jgi:hypothetical protein
MRSCLTFLVVMAVTAPAAAQVRNSPDFFFDPPRGSITVRGSWLFARGGSDWYDFVTENLTLERKDFNAPGFGLDVNIPLTSRLDAGGSFDVSRSNTRSEYRAYVDNNRLPIEQTTSLREINLGGHIRFALLERGRQVSRLAWVPRRIVPFVGAGAGILHYKLEQTGDFIDYQDFSVFGDWFLSDGWAASAQAFGGVDVRLFKHVNATIDGRYLWANAELARDWIGFEPIDLAGFRMSGGVSFIF